MRIEFTVNGRPQQLDVRPERTLLEVLREDLGLTGTKHGCDSGECGACTVLLDGEPVNACLTLAVAVRGREVATIEGLAADGRLHPLQQAFIDHGGLQCGYCSSGMLMGAHALLLQNRAPSRAAIIAGMEHHLCRCGAHQRIVEAIAAASRIGEAS